ncbi:MAG: ECF-type sigma factor [Phycisphaerae bacterium]
MSDQTDTTFIQTLDEVRQGRPGASDRLFSLTYAELRQLAGRLMRKEPAGQTLQPTALVHEAYMRLVGDEAVDWNGRRHFFGAASRAMRRILVERSRRVQADKRGGGRKHEELRDCALPDQHESVDLIALDEALTNLETRDKSMSDVVHMRFFVGLSIDQVAELLETSPRSVDRLWSRAKTWLYSELMD